MDPTFPAELLEKDFWVCWTLRQIFSDPELAPHLRFKGGTSLSKVFDAIQRFSEDIDLAVDWEQLGHSGNPPGSELSKNKLDKLRKRMVPDERQPWKRTLLRPGRGSRAARRATNATGSNTSFRTFLRRARLRVSSRHLQAAAGRKAVRVATAPAAARCA